MAGSKNWLGNWESRYPGILSKVGDLNLNPLKKIDENYKNPTPKPNLDLYFLKTKSWTFIFENRNINLHILLT